jgi:hypothetical protein
MDDAPLLALHFSDAPHLCIGLARGQQPAIDVVYAATSGTGEAVVLLRLLLDLLHELPAEFIRLEFTEGRAVRIIGDGNKIVVLAQCCSPASGARR